MNRQEKSSELLTSPKSPVCGVEKHTYAEVATYLNSATYPICIRFRKMLTSLVLGFDVNDSGLYRRLLIMGAPLYGPQVPRMP